MKPEQVEKLANIEEELVEVFAIECQPKKWPGMQNAKDRGDRYWFKKNALATLTLAARIQTLLREIRVNDRGGDGETPKGDDEATDREAEAAALAKQGIALLERHRARRKS